jgi:hypothetical protein
MAMSTTLDSPPADRPDTNSPDGQILEYRAIYSGALIAVLLGLLSIVVPFACNDLASTLSLTPLPLVGIFMGLRAWRVISRNTNIYTGAPLAIAGVVMSLVFMTAGVGAAGYIYANEVWDGYTRTSFFQFRPDRTEERAGKPIPDDVASLAGKKVFIKGYIRPDSVTSRVNIDRFLLVRDDNQCCFGDISQVKFYDQIDVQLTGNLRIDDRRSLVRVGGTLSIHPESLQQGGQVVYSLEADRVK